MWIQVFAYYVISVRTFLEDIKQEHFGRAKSIFGFPYFAVRHAGVCVCVWRRILNILTDLCETFLYVNN